jgi:hypothetical protein
MGFQFGTSAAQDLGDEPERRDGWIDVRPPRDVFLEDVVLDRAAQHRAVNSSLLGYDDVHREQRGRRRVDGHARGDLVERDPIEKDVHVLHRIDRDANAPDLAERPRGVGIDAHLRRQVERDGESCLPLVQQHAKARICLLRRPETGVLAHGPQPPAVHRGLHPASEGILARVAEVARVVEPLGTRPVHRIDRNAGWGNDRCVGHLGNLMIRP